MGPDAATTFHSQSSFVLPLPGGSFLFMADRWNKTDLEHSGYLWLPLKVEDGRVVIREGAGMGLGSELGAGSGLRLGSGSGLGSRLGPGPGEEVWKKMEAVPLSLLTYSVNVLTDSSDTGSVRGYTFLRFYDEGGRLLLDYKIPLTATVKAGSTGNYTETPPGTKYMTLGIGKDSSGGMLYADDWKVELNIGKPDTPHVFFGNIDQYLRPFWHADTIFNETVLLAPASGRLFYTPDKILSVRSFDLATAYRKGSDYLLEGRTLVRPTGSRMPFRADTSFDTKNDLAWYNLQSQWVVVTYTHHDKFEGATPLYKGGQMPRVLSRLKAGMPVTIVAYGMSITRGMQVSGYDHVPPYMPSYMDLFAEGLRRKYSRSAVMLYNAGLPGAAVTWGAEYADTYINPLHPDLVVIDFGMNDFWRISPEEYKGDIETIIRKVRADNPAAEFLLVANMKFDPDYVLDSDKNKAYYTGNLAGYQRVLHSLENRGVIVLDMTTLSDRIYRRKKAKDCIANPLDPNDYLARWYAQGMLALFIPGR